MFATPSAFNHFIGRKIFPAPHIHTHTHSIINYDYSKLNTNNWRENLIEKQLSLGSIVGVIGMISFTVDIGSLPAFICITNSSNKLLRIEFFTWIQSLMMNYVWCGIEIFPFHPFSNSVQISCIYWKMNRIHLPWNRLKSQTAIKSRITTCLMLSLVICGLLKKKKVRTDDLSTSKQNHTYSFFPIIYFLSSF